MHIATDDHVAWCDSQSVTRLSPARTAERIEVLFKRKTVEGQRNSVLGDRPNPLTARRRGTLPTVRYVNTSVPTYSHSPDAATFERLSLNHFSYLKVKVK